MHVTVYVYNYCIYHIYISKYASLQENKTHMPIQQLNTPAGRKEGQRVRRNLNKRLDKSVGDP